MPFCSVSQCVLSMLVVVLLGCDECMRCRLLLPMSAVSVCQSVCHAGSFSAPFAKSLRPLVMIWRLAINCSRPRSTCFDVFEAVCDSAHLCVYTGRKYYMYSCLVLVAIIDQINEQQFKLTHCRDCVVITAVREKVTWLSCIILTDSKH